MQMDGSEEATSEAPPPPKAAKKKRGGRPSHGDTPNLPPRPPREPSPPRNPLLFARGENDDEDDDDGVAKGLDNEEERFESLLRDVDGLLTTGPGAVPEDVARGMSHQRGDDSTVAEKMDIAAFEKFRGGARAPGQQAKDDEEELRQVGEGGDAAPSRSSRSTAPWRRSSSTRRWRIGRITWRRRVTQRTRTLMMTRRRAQYQKRSGRSSWRCWRVPPPAAASLCPR